MGLRKGLLALFLVSELHWAMGLTQNECQTQKKCDFVCDCLGCSDEQNCGYNSLGFACDFEDALQCGWRDLSGSNVYTWERRQRGNTLPASGPSSDYTTGTSSGWFMAVTSVSEDTPYTAVLGSPMMNQSAVTCQLRIRYFIWDAGHTGLDGEALWMSVVMEDGQQAVVWRPVSSSVRAWREDSIYLGRIPKGFRLRLYSKRSRGLRGDVAIDQLEFLGCALPVEDSSCGPGSVQCMAGGCVKEHQMCDGSDDCGDGSDEKDCDAYWGCDFEDDLCGWDIRTFSKLEWTRTNQLNISTSLPNEPRAGPGRDHSTNTGSGHFLYLTKPESLDNDWSQFQSPVLQPTNGTDPCKMVLYTHQFGPSSGGLSVLVVDMEMYPVWERGGQLGDVWVKAEVEFNVNVTFQIVLVGVIRDEDFGGIAIDSIIMSPGCKIAVNESSPVIAYPDPPGHPCGSSQVMCNFQQDCENGEDEAKCGDFSYPQGIRGWTDMSIGSLGWAMNNNETAGEQCLHVTQAPGQQLSGAQIRTPLLGPSGPACSLQLTYRLFGVNHNHKGDLSVSVIDAVTGVRSRLWEVSGHDTPWLSAQVYIGAWVNRFQLELGAVSDSTHTQIAVKDVRYIGCHPGHLPGTSTGLDCNFETDTCNWYQDQSDNFDWTVMKEMDHTIGVGRSLVVDMWNPSLRGLSGRLLSFPQEPLSSEHCLTFWYKLYGPQTGSLNVKLLSGESEVLVWSRTGAHGNHWQQGLCPVQHQHIRFQIIFEAIRSGFDGRVGIDDIALLKRPCSGPSTCTFEGGSCGYSVSGPSRWINQNQISGNVRPGPKTDHTLESAQGYYMITASGKEFLPVDSKATLSSPLRNSAPNIECVQFWYHMGGENPGSLNVYVKPETGEATMVFSNSLNQGEAWRHAQGNVSSTEAWQLQFEVVGAGGAETYVAVDDIIILPHSCPPPDTECSLERGLCSWSNTQARDQLDWALTSAEQAEHYKTPPYDRTLQTARGHFLLLPSSARDTAGQEALLLSPHLPPTLGTCLKFWVHKSSDSGLVVVRLSGQTEESMLTVGELSEAWRRFDIDIVSKEEYQIVFKGTKGSRKPLALDDIQYTPGVNCTGENTDSESTRPSDNKGGIAASVIVLLLLLVTMAALLVVYLRKKGPSTPRSENKDLAMDGGITNVSYDPEPVRDGAAMNRDTENSFCDVVFQTDSAEREVA